LYTILILLTSNLYLSSTVQAYSLSGNFDEINLSTTQFSKFDGSVLLVDATASWCTACDLQLQNLNKVYASVDDKVSILTLSIDINDDLDKVAELKSRFNSKWYFGLDTNLDFKDQHNVVNLPTLFLFKDDGLLFRKWEGITSPEILVNEINKLIDEPYVPAFETGDKAEVGSLLDDLYSNILFRMVSLLTIVVIVYLKFIPSSSKENIKAN
ncbi:MAG: TlpA family protein disulfide reductase, partial [Candidatus Kariarchaeaceae archaeon]